MRIWLYILLAGSLSLMVVDVAYAQNQFGEICDNGSDDDGDGMVDCNDPECNGGLGGPVIGDCGGEFDCTNGVDDDGDGFIDYYDGDCFDDPDNPNDYIVVEPGCQAMPQGNQFDIEPAWDSPMETSAAMGMPSVADLDQDGIPEVITINGESGWMYILDGTDGTEISSVRIKSGQVFAHPTVGDVDGDGFGEIFTIDLAGNIRVYEHTLGTPKWTATSTFTGWARQLSLADFNQDGVPELYSVNEIYNAATGDLLIQGSHGNATYPSANNWQEELNAVPVAVDILPSEPGLELVLGHIVYSVNITNTTGTAGNSLTEEENMDDATTLPAGYGGYVPKDSRFGNQIFSSTSVVDYDQDGFLDVIMSGTTGDPQDGPSTIFWWNLQTSEVKSYVVTRPAGTIQTNNPNVRNNFQDLTGGSCDNGETCTWKRGTGTINIADIDNDGFLDCTFMSGSSLYAIDESFNELWANHSDYWESSSGFTGTAVFDFDGDGSSEIVYRDEINLYIVDGTTGTPLNFANGFCSSQTQAEYPIIADVDGDGETEIIVSCGRDENLYGESTNTSGTRRYGFIRTYKAANDNYWVPAREVWNQFTYFNVNVNDNLTIPRFQQPHHLNFAQICSDPSLPKSFALNKFLNQSPRISYCGQLVFPSPLLNFGNAPTVAPPVCPDNEFEVTIQFRNEGDEPVNKPIPIAFYRDDPEVAYLNSDPNPWLDTVYVSVPGGLQVGQTLDTTLTITGARGAHTLYISLNDIGPFDKATLNPLTNQEFYPLDSLNGTVRECDADPTIIAVDVIPLPFDVQAEMISDNRRCIVADDGPVDPDDNGEVNVVALDGSTISSSDYNFSWYKVKSPADSVVSSNSSSPGAFNLNEGDYYVIVTHNAYGCASNADTVHIDKIEGWAGADVVSAEIISEVSSCTPGTADGVARVLLNGAPIDETDYLINWREEQAQNADPIVVGDTATGLAPINYLVEVIDRLTGCSESIPVDMSLPIPELNTPDVTHLTNCSPYNGSVSVTVDDGSPSGTTTGYTFRLINQDTQDTTFRSDGDFQGLNAGLYNVTAIDDTNQCGMYAEGEDVEVEDQSGITDVDFDMVPQSACTAPYNGQLTANPTIAGLYSYVWYKGTVTSDPSRVVGNSQTTPDTLSTYITDQYTVVITDNNTGCTLTQSTTLDEDITPPVFAVDDAVITPLTNCAPAAPNGGIDVSVGGDKANYLFRLYEGTNTSTPPAYVEAADGIFTGLSDQKYTIEAISTGTGCATVIPLTVTVTDSTVAPEIDITVINNQTSCDDTDPNGELSATADGQTTGYDFAWEYQEDGTTYSTSSIDNLSRGLYRLTVTNQTDKCTNDATQVVDEVIMQGPDLEITLTPTNRDFCAPFNGEMTVTEIKDTNDTTYNINDFNYTWYRVDDPGIDSTELVGETGPSITGRDIGLYSVWAVNKSTDCESASYAATIGNDAVEPNIDVQPEELMANCIDPDGKFSVEAVDPTGTVDVDEYEYFWYIGNDTTSANFIQEGRVVEDARAARYTVVVKDPNTECKTWDYFDLNAAGNILPVFTAALAEPSLSCDDRPNGLVEAEVDLAVGAGSSQDDYEFYWYAGSSATPLAGGGVGDIDFSAADHSGTGDAGRVWDDRPQGEYTIVAYYEPDGCQSIPQTVKVINVAQSPVVSLINSDPNTNCVLPGTGTLEIEANKAPANGSYPGDTTPDNGYTFAWNDGPAGDTRTNLLHGNYTVTVTDDETNCETTETFTVANNTQLPIITAMATDPQLDCIAPGGSVEVTNLQAGGTDVSASMAADYNFHWYDDAGDFDKDNLASGRVVLGSAGAAGNTERTNLNPGFYFVVAEHATTGCLSFPEEGEVEDDTPEVEIYLTDKEDFITCTGVNEGLIEVSVGNTTAPPYTINWYEGAGTTNDITGTASISNTATTSRIDDLQDGVYTVWIQDDASQCVDSASFTINQNIRKPILVASKISDQTICMPNGSISIDAISLGGNAENFNDYDYTWYQGSLDASGESNFTANAHTFTTTDSLELVDLSADVFFVTATKVNPAGMAGCTTEPYQIIIEDNSVPIIVTLDDISDPITACDPSNKAEGEIEIEVRNGGSYSIRWFNGSSANPADQFVAFDDMEEIEDLVPGFYTVQVGEAATGCETTRTYEIVGIPVPVTVATSASPYTSCIAPNGIIAANANGGSGVYNYAWYVGEDTTIAPMQVPNTQSMVDELINGTYTVVVSDRNEPTCQVASAAVVVEDERGRDIMVNIATDFPVTNCDINNPNGQLSASIDGPMSQYSFFWYEGTNTGTNPLGQGPILANVSAQEYTVVVRDRITGCLSNTFSATVEEGEMVLPPLADVTVTAQQTHCIDPNGVAMALLDESSTDPNVDYIYSWYAGSSVNGQPFYASSRSNEVFGLDEGEFSVTVTNVLTGCVSEPAPFTVEEILTYPDFEITTTPATCAESNGTANIVFVEQVDVAAIEWRTPIGYDDGFSLQSYPAGEYEVTLTDGNGCSTTKSAIIETNIRVFNGVSPNSDGKNDTFIISCIENFDNNLVKIFNRAGALVYENNNYDNEMVYFDGIGNRGLYIGGQELPDGTYYYIIDKRNGDKPESGYLELLR